MDFPETRQKKLLRIEKKLVDLGGKIVELAASMVLQSSWPNKQQTAKPATSKNWRNGDSPANHLQITSSSDLLCDATGKYIFFVRRKFRYSAFTKSKDSFLIHMRLSCCMEMFQFQSHPDTERMILAIWGLKLTSATDIKYLLRWVWTIIDTNRDEQLVAEM
uniref:Uncharacterized protein n=1 Tax=Oryza rufipogon TaxID=4529 RepID=A0A0E0QBA9_ORYRU